MPWFHGSISREEADKRLNADGHEDGKFLWVVLIGTCIYHLIFYVTRFSIGWKIGVILYHPKKSICDVYAQTSQNTQAP
jgi:hypothetical protein